MEKYYEGMKQYLEKRKGEPTGNTGFSSFQSSSNITHEGDSGKIELYALTLKGYSDKQRTLIDTIMEKAKKLGKVIKEETFRKNLAKMELEELENLLNSIEELEAQQQEKGEAKEQTPTNHETDAGIEPGE